MSNSNNNLKENEPSSPYDIAQIVFSKEPGKPFTNQLWPDESLLSNNDSVSTIFEVLITILMEGINIVSGGIDKIDATDFTVEHIIALQPWFSSFGIKVNTLTQEECNNYYCQVIFKNNGYDPLFEMKNIDKNYHFLMSPYYVHECHIDKLEDIKCVFKKVGSFITISFSYLQ